MMERTDAVRGAEPPRIHLFLYGTLLNGAGSELLSQAERVGAARVAGALYDLGDYPALVLAGGGAVEGEVWRAPADLLVRLDAYEAVAEGLFRRVAVLVDRLPCWTYVAGPALAPRIEPARRIPAGRWAAA